MLSAYLSFYTLMSRNNTPAPATETIGNSFTSSKGEYAEFCDYLERSSGITLGENKSYLVHSRLRAIMETYNLNSLGALVKLLNDKRSLTLEKEVIDAMTTNETSWFRDVYPFEFLQGEILTQIPMTHKKPFRIWSAACSFGHEPYSIGLVVQEFLDKNPGRLPGGVEIIGTDISNKALDHATAGFYKQGDTERGLSQERLNRYFQKQGEGYQIRDQIKRKISFRKHNLIMNTYTLGMFDVIFCRNVLIYFSNENKEKILKNMVKALVPNGYLLLGASEPMACYSDSFEMVPCKRGVVYRLKGY